MVAITLQSLELSTLVWSIINVMILVYVTLCILLGMLKYRSFGLWMKLIVGVQLTLMADITRLITRHTYYAVLQKPPVSVQQIQTLNRLFFSMYSVGQVFFNVTHWIFAFKYWVLAFKLHLLTQNISPTKHSSKFITIYYIGIVFNFICGLFYGIPINHYKWRTLYTIG
jgi:hypothetical protein